MRGSDVETIGRYEVLKHLASGGMGSLYLARTTGLAGFERHVVLKIIEADVDDEDALGMFLDEARVLGRMHHQHIATAYELERDSRGHYVLVMDYIHGQSLKRVWERTAELGVSLPLNFTLTVGMAAASALQYAHSLRSRDNVPLRIVHRDVSLSNLLIGYDGAIKLIDFGIAKAALRTTRSYVGEIKGNLGYMAPEQLAGEPIDHRVDIFALGAVLYELVTMTRAFPDTARRVVPPSQIVRGLPHELEEVIAKALHLDPAARYQDAERIRRDLEAIAREHKLVIGDASITTVMEVLFEHREEPWREGVPEHTDDDKTLPARQTARPPDDHATVPVPVTIEPRNRRRARAAAQAMGPFQVTPVPGSVVTPPIRVPTNAPTRYPRGSSSGLPVPIPAQVQIIPVSRRRWPIIVAVLLTIAVLVGCAIVLTRPPSHEAPAMPPAPQPPPLAPPEAKVSPSVTPISVQAASPEMVTIRITTTPVDATVLLDGQRLGHTPLVAQVPRAGDGLHIIKIRRRGCVTRRIDVELTGDIERDVELQPSE